MKKNLKKLYLIAAVGGLTAGSHAQTVVLSQNFDSLSSGAYGSLNNYDGGGNPTASIVAPGAGGSGRALELTGRTITSGNTGNFGVNIGNITLTGATSANLSAYTLSFDLAIGAADPGGYSIDVGIYGAGNEGNSYHPAVPTAGAGYTSFSVNMGTLGLEYGTTDLTPATLSAMSLDLQVNGFPVSASGMPDIFLDNVQITMLQPTPEPSSIALCVFGLVGGLVWSRRRQVLSKA